MASRPATRILYFVSYAHTQGSGSMSVWMPYLVRTDADVTALIQETRNAFNGYGPIAVMNFFPVDPTVAIKVALAESA